MLNFKCSTMNDCNAGNHLSLPNHPIGRDIGIITEAAWENNPFTDYGIMGSTGKGEDRGFGTATPARYIPRYSQWGG